MAELKKAANGYDYYSYESEYLNGEWDTPLVLPDPQPVVREKKQPQEQVRVATAPKTYSKTQQARKRAIAYCTAIIVCFAMFIGVIYRYAVISQMNMDNIEAMERIDELKTEVDTLELKLSNGSDLKTVQEKATELGMDFPNQSQIVYVNMKETQTSLDENTTNESTGWFNRLWNGFLGMIE